MCLMGWGFYILDVLILDLPQIQGRDHNQFSGGASSYLGFWHIFRASSDIETPIIGTPLNEILSIKRNLKIINDNI